MNRLPMIDHIQKVKEKLYLLDILKELDITSKFISKLSEANDQYNPLDYFYDMLKIDIKY